MHKENPKPQSHTPDLQNLPQLILELQLKRGRCNTAWSLLAPAQTSIPNG